MLSGNFSPEEIKTLCAAVDTFESSTNTPEKVAQSMGKHVSHFNSTVEHFTRSGTDEFINYFQPPKGFFKQGRKIINFARVKTEYGKNR